MDHLHVTTAFNQPSKRSRNIAAQPDCLSLDGG